MDFKGKVVLITGASAGIGAETAVHLASLGASLSLSGRNEERLKSVAEKCKNAGSLEEPLTVIGDVSKENDVDNLLKETIKHYGRLDVLVNNAGIVERGNLEKMTLDEFDRVLNTNLRAVVQLTKLAAPHLIASKGNIVNVSSVAGVRPVPTILAYSVSKAALDQFTKCAAVDLAPKQVRVNSVNPGGIATDMLQSLFTVDGKVDDAAYDQYRQTHPSERFGGPDEVASAVAFLASDGASNITGVLLSVDGGLYINPPI